MTVDINTCVLLLVCFGFSKSVPKNCWENRRQVNGERTNISICCRPLVEKNGSCEECKPGTGITETEPDVFVCAPCNDGRYGYNCRETCTCLETQRCDAELGCVNMSSSTEGGHNGQDKTNANHGTSDLVIYMSCIAAVGLLIAFSIAIYRNRLCVAEQLSTMLGRIPMFPRLEKNIHDVVDAKADVRKSENFYDDINEKYMIKDFVGK